MVSGGAFSAHCRVCDAGINSSFLRCRGMDSGSYLPFHRYFIEYPTADIHNIFGCKWFEEEFIGQGEFENRSFDQTLDIGWNLLSEFPERELKRCDPDTITWARDRGAYRPG